MKKTISKALKVLKPVVGSSLFIDKIPGYFLIVCLVASFLFLFNILLPFATVISIAVVLVVAFYPIHSRIVKFFRGHKGWASIVSCLLVILIIIIPIAVFILLMASEGVGAYAVIQEKVNSGFLDKFLQWKDGGFFFDLKRQIDPVINLDSLDIKANIISAAQNVSSFLVSQTTNLLKSLSALMLDFILLLFSMFYFFKDGDVLIERIKHYSPLPSRHEKPFFEKLKSMVSAILIGSFLTGIIQGLVGGVGFAIAGIPNVFFWTAMMAFASFIPLIGTMLIWLPAAIILIATGDYTWGIFLLIWGLVVVGVIDNLVRPYLVGGKAHTYPLLTFFVLLGGIFTMGFAGIIVGPMVLMAFMAFLHIYEIEYGKVLKQ
jgi:predicted PurR-regulated permease PerM